MNLPDCQHRTNDNGTTIVCKSNRLIQFKPAISREFCLTCHAAGKPNLPAEDVPVRMHDVCHFEAWPSVWWKHDGVGDTLHAVCRFLRLNRLAEWFEAKTGSGCGCANRRKALNTKLRYRWRFNSDG